MKANGISRADKVFYYFYFVILTLPTEIGIDTLTH